jgi:hypothetical protein
LSNLAVLCIETVMRRNGSKLLTSVILAIYGGISLLGHGLHWLLPEEGHHHGLHVVACSSHRHELDHDCDHHHHAHQHHHGPSESGDDGGNSREQTVQSNECGTHSHLCEICNFLSQARGERTQLAAAVDWQPLADAVVSRPEQSYKLTSLSQHAPRGPPQVG